MAYVLSGLGAWDESVPHERRAEDALEALRAVTAYLREDHRAPIRDGAGQSISLAQLLTEANGEARSWGDQARLATALADWVEATRERDLEHARQMYEMLTGPRYEQEMLIAESLGGATDEQRRCDAEERRRLRDYLFDDGSWREAGAAWARDFGQPPLQEVVDELILRHPGSYCPELRLGAEEWLSRSDVRLDHYEARPTADGFWGVWSKEKGQFQHTYVFEGIARAHAEAFNSGRPWTDKDFGREMQVAVDRIIRRSERVRWARASSPSPPSPPQQTRPGSTRGGRSE
jgi:hypothetical protein